MYFYLLLFYCLHYVAACDEAHATSNINDDMLTIPECCTDSTQCCTEENEVPAAAAEMVIVIYQVIYSVIMKTEMVIERNFLCLMVTQTQN